MTQPRIVTIGRLLADHIPGVYSLLDAAAAVDAGLPATPEPVTGNETYVEAALRDPEVMGHMLADRKINAIKRLRTVAQCGLKEAKDAVENERVGGFVATIKRTLRDDSMMLTRDWD